MRSVESVVFIRFFFVQAENTRVAAEKEKNTKQTGKRLDLVSGLRYVFTQHLYT